MKKISSPLEKTEIRKLKAGEEVLLSGVIYTARDQAHKRLVGAKKAPFNLKGAVLYYCGPAPAPRGKVMGSAGPTTSARMDDFTPALLKKGILGMIGKGKRSPQVIGAIKKCKAVYFLAYSGCGALLSQYVKKAKAFAYKELGTEAVYRLEVKDFPLIVGIDSRGRSIYGQG